MKMAKRCLIVSFFFILGGVFFSVPASAEKTVPPIDRNPDHYCRRPNASCVQLACFYGHCNTDAKIEEVTLACHGVWDDGCIRTLCNYRGRCSFRDRFLYYVDLCGGN